MKQIGSIGYDISFILLAFIVKLIIFTYHFRFQVKKKQFFHNFLPIMLFGVVGVFISSVIISAGNIQACPYFLVDVFSIKCSDHVTCMASNIAL